jgi:hypothetical protein
MDGMTPHGLLNEWRDAAMKVREAVAMLDTVQAKAHRAVLARDSAAARRYKTLLLDALRPVEDAVEGYIEGVEAMWMPAVEALAPQERGSA